MRIKNSLIAKRAGLFTAINKCRILRLHRPVVAYLNITDKCNLRCRYCFVDMRKEHDELSTSEWINLIDNLYARGAKMVCLMGGEPLLHKDIDKLISHILRRGMICDVTTNGVLVPQKIDLIKQVDLLMISIDGGREANDANRGEGSFSKAMEAIRVAGERGITVRINAVMTRQSKGSIDFLLELARRYNLYVTFSITAKFPAAGREQEEEIRLSDREIKDIYKRLKVLKARGERVLFSASTLDYVINYPLSYNRIIFRGDKENEKYYSGVCPFGRTMFYVDANGDFYPCAALWSGEHFKPKNLRRDSFDGAWQNMAHLPCRACFCPGVPEWNRIMSFKGLLSGIKVTLEQAMLRG